MKCSHCRNKGYIESSIAKDAEFKPMILKCPNQSCPFTQKYYQKVRELNEIPELKVDKKVQEAIINQIFENSKVERPKDFNIEIPASIIKEGPNKIQSFISEAFNKYQEDKRYTSKYPTEYPAVYSDIPSNHNSNNLPGSSVYKDIPVSDKSIDNDLNNIKYPIGSYCNTNPNKAQATQEPRDRDQQGGTNGVRSNQSRGKVEMDTEYPHIPKQVAQVARRLLSSEQGAMLMLDTPMGPIQVESLAVANRFMGIINSYMEHSEELDYAHSLENVTVFPLERALGLV